MPIQIVTTYANAISSACGLDFNQAKTAVYWGIATHGIDKLEIMPILVSEGGHGTGKSTLMKLLKQICHEPRTIDGKVTKSELRDSLELHTTALIEEADGVYERLILMRYARQTANTTVKRGSASKGWTREPLNLFGATVLHRREPFKDPAVDSRSITIRTAYKKQGVSPIPALGLSPLSSIAANVDWSKTLAIPDGRAADTWMPLFQAAYYCNDTDWLVYASGELIKAIASLSEGQGYEPSQLVVSKVVSLAMDPTSKLKPRVSLKEITKGLKDDGNNLNPWQVGKMLRGLGFKPNLSGGTQYVLIDKAHLMDVAKRLGIDDDVLKNLPP